MKSVRSTVQRIPQPSFFIHGVIFIGAILLVSSALHWSNPGRTSGHVPTSGMNEPASKGVCPPFNLYDEDGKLIDPVHNINANTPYSPKQTCGKCHDYNKITEGFHFQQGTGEHPTDAKLPYRNNQLVLNQGFTNLQVGS